MFSIFAPSYIKEARLVLKNARRLLHYKKDVLPEPGRKEFQASIERLQQAINAHAAKPTIETAAMEVDQQAGKYLPPAADAGWRENCEVFLVAIVIAIGVRTYFLQPFTIPTGSMQPTLNGIIGHPSTDPPPNVGEQLLEFFVYGRNYLNVTAKSDDVVTDVTERKMLLFVTFSEVQCQNGSYRIWAPKDTLRDYFNVRAGRSFHAGDAIARGWVDAGDHVFVDKLSYNLHQPTRGDVFVFSTKGIPRIEENLTRQGIEGSEFYIKRLNGLPGDTLRVSAPLLYVNGQEAQEFGIRRVMSREGDYGGYTNPSPMDAFYLTDPTATFTVPPKTFFAMGDNSANSFDSRYWGPVPQENVMGRGLFVYWPFLPHWGFVK